MNERYGKIIGSDYLSESRQLTFNSWKDLCLHSCMQEDLPIDIVVAKACRKICSQENHGYGSDMQKDSRMDLPFGQEYGYQPFRLSFQNHQSCGIRKFDRIHYVLRQLESQCKYDPTLSRLDFHDDRDPVGADNHLYISSMQIAHVTEVMGYILFNNLEDTR